MALAALALLGLSCGQADLVASVLLTSDGTASGGTSAEGVGGGTGTIGLGGLGSVPTPPDPYQPAPTLFAYEGRLRDHCGEPLALRGVAEFIGWTAGSDGDPEYFEMAKTGANAVRVMWQQTGEAAALGLAIENAVAEGLVPVVELQGTFRSVPEDEALRESLAYWLQPAVLEVLIGHEKSLVLEISSWVTQSLPRVAWVDLYADALAELRAAGLRLPIAIVEPTWSLDPVNVAEAMVELAERDPLHNVVLAFDFWSGGTFALETRLQAFRSAGVASYISEFSEYRILDCPDSPIDVSAVMRASAQYDGSWFAWSWGAIPNAGSCAGYLDMTTDGTVLTLTDYGNLVALEDPNGISRTATAFRTHTAASCPL